MEAWEFHNIFHIMNHSKTFNELEILLCDCNDLKINFYPVNMHSLIWFKQYKWHENNIIIKPTSFENCTQWLKQGCACNLAYMGVKGLMHHVC